ncbi:MAG: hypothetical protein ACYDBJ_05745 [Aggregatilineales bacterium]
MINTATETTLTLALGYEELVFLLALLKLPTLPGLDADSLAEFRNESGAARLAAAQHSLQARGLIGIKADKTVVVDQLVANFLVGCVTAQASVIVGTTLPDGVSTRILYAIGSSLIIEYMIPEPGIHHFTALSDLTALASMMLLRTQINAQASAAHPLSIVIAPDWLRVHRTAQATGGDATALAALVEAGAAPSISRQFHEIATRLAALHTFIGLRAVADQPPTEFVFSVLHCNEELWLMQSRTEQQISLSQVSAVEVSQQIVNMFRQLLPELFEA